MTKTLQIGVLAGLGIGALSLSVQLLPAADPKMTVYRTATCGCCGKWVDHLEANGFDVDVQTVTETASYRQKYGVPAKLASCHTGVLSGYTVEGHVPAADIKRLLKEKPKGKGLAVPGMPLGSPGMEAPKSERYAVLLFQEDGSTTVFAQH
jgi:hypothetical protein